MKKAIGFLVWVALRVFVWLARKPSVTFFTPEGKPYLTRWPLATVGAWPDAAGRTAGAGWYLHKITRSDHERTLHNHPSPGFAVVLRGGYSEERYEWRREHGVVERLANTATRWLGPLATNLLTSHTFHRVELPPCTCTNCRIAVRVYDEQPYHESPAPSWSLFYFAPRTGIGWGFLQGDGSVRRAAHNDGNTGEKTERKDPVLL